MNLHGVALIARDSVALAGFYTAALGFTAAQEAGGVTMTLGAQRLDLIAAAPNGAAYPEPGAANDPWFQHIAVVVTDMRAACRRLLAHGAAPISTGGPQRLPASSGGVTAFKCRDPEGHPLELLHFPANRRPAYWRACATAGPCVGIDHSAIVVADTARSVRFYAALGLHPAGGSHNRGSEQAALDGLADPVVVVTALAVPGADPPHLELLDYRAPAPAHRHPPWESGDIVATRTLLTGTGPALLRDPDGHFIAIRAAP